jgi:hypothetical protein
LIGSAFQLQLEHGRIKLRYLIVEHHHPRIIVIHERVSTAAIFLDTAEGIQRCLRWIGKKNKKNKNVHVACERKNRPNPNPNPNPDPDPNPNSNPNSNPAITAV